VYSVFLWFNAVADYVRPEANLCKEVGINVLEVYHV